MQQLLQSGFGTSMRMHSSPVFFFQHSLHSSIDVEMAGFVFGYCGQKTKCVVMFLCGPLLSGWYA